MIMKYGTELETIARRFEQTDVRCLEEFGVSRGYDIDTGVATYASSFRMQIPRRKGVSYEFIRGNIVGLNDSNYSLKRRGQKQSAVLIDNFNGTLTVNSTGISDHEIQFLDQLSRDMIEPAKHGVEA